MRRSNLHRKEFEEQENINEERQLVKQSEFQEYQKLLVRAEAINFEKEKSPKTVQFHNPTIKILENNELVKFEEQASLIELYSGDLVSKKVKNSQTSCESANPKHRNSS